MICFCGKPFQSRSARLRGVIASVARAAAARCSGGRVGVVLLAALVLFFVFCLLFAVRGVYIF